MIHLTVHQLSAHLDGALVGTSLDLVGRHLFMCEECRAEFDRLRANDEALARLIRHDSNDAFFDAFHDEIARAVLADGQGAAAAAPAPPPAPAEPVRVAPPAPVVIVSSAAEPPAPGAAPIEVVTAPPVVPPIAAVVPPPPAAAPLRRGAAGRRPHAPGRAPRGGAIAAALAVLVAVTLAGTLWRASLPRHRTAPARAAALATPAGEAVAVRPPEPVAPAPSEAPSRRPADAPDDPPPALAPAAPPIERAASPAPETRRAAPPPHAPAVAIGAPARTGADAREAPPASAPRAELARDPSPPAPRAAAAFVSGEDAAPRASGRRASIVSPPPAERNDAAARTDAIAVRIEPAPAAPRPAAAPAPIAPAPATTPAPSGPLALLCGEVRDDEGGPVVGAQVMMADAGVAVVTDRAGRFCVSAPAGERTVSVLAMGFKPFRRVVTVARAGADLAVTLTTAAPVGQASAAAPGEEGPGAMAPEIAAVVRAAERLGREAHDVGSARLFDESASEWERAVRALERGPHELDARRRLAEARYRAWELDPSPVHRDAALAAVERFLSAGPTAPGAATIRAWRLQLER